MPSHHPVSGCDLRVRAHLVCPTCRGELTDVPDGLVCVACGVVFAVEDGVPHMLPERARRVAVDRVGPRR